MAQFRGTMQSGMREEVSRLGGKDSGILHTLTAGIWALRSWPPIRTERIYSMYIKLPAQVISREKS